MDVKRFLVIDILKYICACMVVFLHTVNVEVLLGTGELIKNILFKFVQFLRPVEFFFISAGFLFFRKSPNLNDIKKYIKRLMILYIFYSFFYIKSITQNFANRGIIYNIASIVKQYCIVGYSSFSWYIPSLIFGIVVIYLLKKYVKKQYLRWILVIIITIMALLMTSYKNVFSDNIQKIIDIFPVSLIRSVIYIFLGEIIYREFLNNKIGNERDNFIFWMICFLLQLVEQELLKKYIEADCLDITIFKIIGTYYMLKTVISFNKLTKLEIKLNTNIFSKASIVIYFLHMFVVEMLNKYDFNVYLEWIMIIIILSILTCFMENLSKKEQFKWIKYVM